MTNSAARAGERLGCPSPGMVFETSASDSWRRLTSIGGRGWVCGFLDADENLAGAVAQVARLSSLQLPSLVEPIRNLWPLSVGKEIEFSIISHQPNVESIGAESVVRCKTTKTEKITVKGGTFDTHVIQCIPVKNDGAGFGKRTYWYARKLGFLIKVNVNSEADDIEQHSSFELISISRAEVDKTVIEAHYRTIDALIQEAVRASPQRASDLVGLPRDPFKRKGWIKPNLDKMVLVPAGGFPLGDWHNEGYENESARFEVYLDPYWIDVYEVTNIKYKKFLSAASRSGPRFAGFPYVGRPYQPVVGVSWADAEAYCRWAGKRLPTEFEWEKAARGSGKQRYPWGDEAPNRGGVLRANLGTGKDIGKDGFVYPAPVGSYPQGVSPYGVHDMAGNVWEWTATWFDDRYYRKLAKEIPPIRNPQGPKEGKYKTSRGGAWVNSAWTSRVSVRFPTSLGSRDMTLGFRCARDVRAHE